MTNKIQQLTNEIELLYQEGLDNSYGDIINDIEYKSNPLQINALESLQKMGELKAELKGRQEARKEILKFIEKERDNGNIEMEVNCKKGQKGFSASLCLSKLIKELKDDNSTM